MKRIPSPTRMALLTGALALWACNPIITPPLVQFGESPQIGKWQAVNAAGAQDVVLPPGAAGAAAVGVTGGSGALVAGSSGVVSTTTAGRTGGAGMLALAGSGAAGGNAGAAAIGGRGGSAGSSGAAGLPAAGSGGTSGTGATGAVASVTFDVMTAAQGGLYQPRNIGAIWIQDSSGHFMKSLEVWAGIRRTYLTKYNAAHGSTAVDVTASATLNSHRMHHATWNLKDRSGAAAPPGKYTLYIELTDTDWTGQFDSVDFDTSMGPQTLTPTANNYYSAMKLQLQ
jgi:hypothetical protein